MVRISADLTQVLYLVEGDKEESLTYEPPGFKPIKELEILKDGPEWLKDRRALEVYLHPSVSYRGKARPQIKEILGGEGAEGV